MGGLQYRAFLFASKNGVFRVNDYMYTKYLNRAQRCKDYRSANKFFPEFKPIALFNASV